MLASSTHEARSFVDHHVTNVRTFGAGEPRPTVQRARQAQSDPQFGPSVGAQPIQPSTVGGGSNAPMPR